MQDRTRKAVVLAAFGVSRIEGLEGIMNVKKRVEAAFPDTPVELAFTSGMIRSVWRRRRHNPEWLAAHPAIPPEVLEIKGPLAAIAGLQDEGYRQIAVQSLHVYAGEEYVNLKAHVDALRSIRTVKPKQRPFDKLVLGRPALGVPGSVHRPEDDLSEAAAAMREDVEKAREDGSALVYLGHGNRNFDLQVYVEFEEALHETYPETPVFLGLVEGRPSATDVVEHLRRTGVKKVSLVPFLLVPGGHAIEDMAGDGDRSWKVIMEQSGFEVDCVLRGLGELDAWADIYVRHLREAMDEAGMDASH